MWSNKKKIVDAYHHIILDIFTMLDYSFGLFCLLIEFSVPENFFLFCFVYHPENQ